MSWKVRNFLFYNCKYAVMSKEEKTEIVILIMYFDKIKVFIFRKFIYILNLNLFIKKKWK